MATDERPHVASEPLASTPPATGGNGNGYSAERAQVAAGVNSFAPSTAPTTRPAPAVPLVPPSRPANRPVAPTPIARTGAPTSTQSKQSKQSMFVDPDLDAEVETIAAPAPLRVRPPVRLRMARRPRVRKVNRTVRRVDAWSVFKIALVFWAVAVVILLVAGVLLWNLAESTGTLVNVEGFIKELFGLETFEFDGGKVFRSAWMIGAVLVVAMTAMSVTMAVLFNLISDLLGGVRVTVLEEEVVLRRVGDQAQQAAPPPATSAGTATATTNGG